MVDITTLRSARPDTLDDAARSWQAISAGLDMRVSGLKREVIAPLRDDWSGRAAEAAVTALDGRAQDLAVTREYADTMAAVMRDAATGVADAQACLKAAEDLAARNDLTIGPDGSVLPRSPVVALGGAMPRAEALLRAPPPMAGEVSALVKRALEVAGETDTQITARLRAIGLFTGTTTGNPAAALAQLAAAGSLAGLFDQAAIPARGTDPAEVNAWWKALSAADRQRLITHFPSRIGWLDGLPATARDSANRLALEREKAQLTAQLRSSPQAPGITGKLAQIATLENGLASAERTTGQQAFLLGFDTSGGGHAIVAVGNPDTATNTVTYVPGLGSTVSGAGGDIKRTAAMWQMANRYASPGQTISSVYWLNYNAPQWSGIEQVADAGDAVAGARNLTGFQAGLGAAHQPGVPDHTTVLGHSYGSLVVGEAAARDHLKPTDLVFVGSPGVGVDHASQLGISPSHVWAGANEHDPVTYTQWFGNNPATGPFGGQGFDASKDPGQSFWPVDLSAHSSYWDPNSSSLFNMSHIVVGHYGPVIRAH